MRHELYPLRPSRALTIDLFIPTGRTPLSHQAPLIFHSAMHDIIMG